MFVRAIEIAAEFTRPIHFVTRAYGAKTPRPGAATLFMVNDEGWALTCKHVATELIAGPQVNGRYAQFKTDLAALPKGKSPKQWKRELEKRAGLQAATTAQMEVMFVGCADTASADLQMHPTLDIALIHFTGHSRLFCSSFPKFAKNGGELKQGKFLCRLGFPFPEFENFEYDPAADVLKWNQAGRQNTPRFPIEGMVTRHLVGDGGRHIGFEMSTPGLRGQSGGPAVDAQGVVWGMQAATGHLDLDFDVDQEVFRNGIPKKVKDSAFLHVGHCIHVDELKDFMRTHSVRFEEVEPHDTQD